MWRFAFIGALTIALAFVGLYLGLTIHGPTIRAVLASVCGAAGGFGIGVIGFDVWRQQQSVKRPAGD